MDVGGGFAGGSSGIMKQKELLAEGEEGVEAVLEKEHVHGRAQCVQHNHLYGQPLQCL